MLFGIDWHMWASFSTFAIIILWYNKNCNIWIEQAKYNEFVSKKLVDIKYQTVILEFYLKFRIL